VLADSTSVGGSETASLPPALNAIADSIKASPPYRWKPGSLIDVWICQPPDTLLALVRDFYIRNDKEKDYLPTIMEQFPISNWPNPVISDSTYAVIKSSFKPWEDEFAPYRIRFNVDPSESKNSDGLIIVAAVSDKFMKVARPNGVSQGYGRYTTLRQGWPSDGQKVTTVAWILVREDVLNDPDLTKLGNNISHEIGHGMGLPHYDPHYDQKNSSEVPGVMRHSNPGPTFDDVDRLLIKLVYPATVEQSTDSTADSVHK